MGSGLLMFVQQLGLGRECTLTARAARRCRWLKRDIAET